MLPTTVFVVHRGIRGVWLRDSLCIMRIWVWLGVSSMIVLGKHSEASKVSVVLRLSS